MAYAFPASQAALARVVEADDRVPGAARYVRVIQGKELANGYVELTDPDEQAARIAAHPQLRRDYQRAELPIDQHLTDALRERRPECAGVALGVDRLVMLALGANSIDEVIAFPLGRA